MTVSIQPLRCGSLTAPRSMFVEGGDDEELSIPVPAWLIRHPEGIVLFDTGMSKELTRQGEYLDGVEAFFHVGLPAGQLLEARLREAEVDPDDVDVVVLSHLHFDHAGGLAQVPNARVVIHTAEWAAGHDDGLVAANGFVPQDYAHGHDVITVDGAHDVFGDGRIVTIPTPGHTPGHQSLLVRTDATTDDGMETPREVVLCADCAYFESTLTGGALPPIGHDRETQAASISRLRAMRDSGALVIPGHDPLTFRTLPDRL